MELNVAGGELVVLVLRFAVGGVVLQNSKLKMSPNGFGLLYSCAGDKKDIQWS